MKPEFESDLICGDWDVLHKKNTIEVLCRQLQILSVKEDVYFRPGQFWELDARAHRQMETKLFLDIYNERKIEVMCPEKKNMVWNENQKKGESLLLSRFNISQTRRQQH